MDRKRQSERERHTEKNILAEAGYELIYSNHEA